MAYGWFASKIAIFRSFPAYRQAVLLVSDAETGQSNQPVEMTVIESASHDRGGCGSCRISCRVIYAAHLKRGINDSIRDMRSR